MDSPKKQLLQPKKKKNNSKTTLKSQQSDDTSASFNNDNLIDTLVPSLSKRTTRSRAEKRGPTDAGLETPVVPVRKPSKKLVKKKSITKTPSESASDESVEELNNSKTSRRGRGRGRARSRGRGRPGTGGKNARMWLPTDPLMRAAALASYYRENPDRTETAARWGFVEEDVEEASVKKPAKKKSTTKTLNEKSADKKNSSQRSRGRGRGRGRGTARKKANTVKMWLPIDPMERKMALSALRGKSPDWDWD